MSDQTFEQLWKRVLLYAPDCPLPLAQEFVNTAYSRALSAHPWAGTRKESAFIIPDAYTTGTVTATQGSTSVTGAGTVWTAAMTGRQIQFSDTGPYYTVTFGSGTTLTLDRAYAGTSGSGLAYSIFYALLEPPSDLLYILSARDLTNNWKLFTGHSVEQIDRWDTQRTTTGTPWMLAAGAAFTSGGQPRWELWPRALSARQYAILYVRKPALLSAASDRPLFPIRGDILRAGALAELSRWPGTSKMKNPLYDLNQHALYEQSFQNELQKAKTEDQEITNTAIRYDEWERIPNVPIDAAFLQTHGGDIW